MAYPQVREMVPDFTLESADGRRIRVSDFRGHRDLVLIFPGDGTDRSALELLHALSAQKAELDSEETAVLVILHGDFSQAAAMRETDAVPFPVLADSDGSVHARYGALVVLTDRYGEIYSAYRDRWPSAEDVMASLRHINAECPE